MIQQRGQPFDRPQPRGIDYLHQNNEFPPREFVRGEGKLILFGDFAPEHPFAPPDRRGRNAFHVQTEVGKQDISRLLVQRLGIGDNAVHIEYYSFDHSAHRLRMRNSYRPKYARIRYLQVISAPAAPAAAPGLSSAAHCRFAQLL